MIAKGPKKKRRVSQITSTFQKRLFGPVGQV